jgi:hypothetical protein
MNRRLGIILVLTAAAAPVFPQKVTKVGTTAANILQVGAGARAVSMGSAFVAVADDITAMYWNPAATRPGLRTSLTITPVSPSPWRPSARSAFRPRS